MSDLINALGEDYFRRALIMVVSLGVVGGVAGTHVLLRRLSFYVVALSHSTFPAVVIAGMIGFGSLLGGMVGAFLTALTVAVIGRQRVSGNANAIGVVLGGAFALGIALVTAFPERVNPAAVLTGSIVSVTQADLATTAVAMTIALLGFALLHKELVFSAFDPTGASAAGYRTLALDFLAMVFIGLVVVASIPAVGSLLGVSLLIAPALAARSLTSRLMPALALSCFFGVISGVGGLASSVVFDIAAGGAIAVTSVVVLAVMAGLGRLRTTSRAGRQLVAMAKAS